MISVTFSIQALIAITTLVGSFIGYVIWASLRIGALQNQVRANEKELDSIEKSIAEVKRDLSTNYVHNNVLGEIKQQLTDIKDAINALKR